MIRSARVALLIESSRSSGREILQGVAHYVRVHTRWSIFYRERALHDPVPKQLTDWKADGIIARVENTAMVRQLRRLRLPVVDVLGWHHIPGVPCFRNDREAIVRTAIEHLRDRGLTQLAYCGFPGLRFSEERARLFKKVLGELGYPAFFFDQPHQRPIGDTVAAETFGLLREATLGRWLKELPKPVGLMACNDVCAQQVLGVCQRLSLRVPDEIAVLGVDNDEVLCELSDPTLTSVRLNNEQIGYQAAAMLDRMLRGKKPSPLETRLPPIGVVSRRSTDTLVLADTDVAAALRFIREHATDGIRVTDVLKHVNLSPSTLKRRFASHLGRSPKAEILRVQLDQARHLLSTTTMVLQDVARLAGFQQVEWFCKLFHKSVGQTPGNYRKVVQSAVRPYG